MLKYQSLPFGTTDRANSLQLSRDNNRYSQTDNYINNGYTHTTTGYQRNRHDRRRNHRNHDSVNPDYYSIVLGNRNRGQSTRIPNRYNINRHRDNTNRHTHNRNRPTDRQQIQRTQNNGHRQGDYQRNRQQNRVLPPTHRYDASVVIEESESRHVDRGRPGERREKSYYISSLSGGNHIPNRKKQMPAYTQSFPFMNKMKDKMHHSGINGHGQNDPMHRGNAALGDNGRVPIVVSEPIDPQTVAAVYNWKITGYTACNKTCGSGM